MCNYEWDEIWRFETRNFTMLCEVTPEQCDPIGHFDDDGETVARIDAGELEWFETRVIVLLRAGPSSEQMIIGADYLGACCYEKPSDFVTGHRDPDPMARNCAAMRAINGENAVICHYFPDMVRTALSEARTTLARLPKLRAA